MKQTIELVLLAVLALNATTIQAGASANGKWIGSTVCAGVRLDFQAELQGSTGTMGFTARTPNGPQEYIYPVNVSFLDGWEGQWINFNAIQGAKTGGFDEMSGLLSGNGASLTFREGPELIDCQEFVMSKTSSQPVQPVSAPAGNPGSREPTAEEMRSALEFALHGNAESLEIDNPINGMTMKITSFEKLGCSRAVGRPGYNCEYLIDVSTQLHSNEGSAAGAQNTNAWQKVLDGMMDASNARNRTNSGRFLYVEGRERWMKLTE